MRKFFASLKSVVAATLVGAMTLAVSCSYDDSAINKRVDQVEKDLAALTERVDALEKKLASEVESLEALIDGKVVVVDVVTDAEGNTTIKLSNGKEITVFAAEDTLQYRVTDGVLEVSADGKNWVAIDDVAADQIVTDVVVNEDGTVTVTLADGQEFTVVKAELIECEAAKAGVYVLPGATKEVAFCVNDAVADINIMNQPLGWSATVEEAVEAPEAPEAGEDEGGAAPMPLAAGGQNYVLKINGPAASFKDAAKEGVVSVHFNTAAGACKVLTVNVTLAELTLAVDGDGNITITNSIAYEQEDYFGDKFVDFADFYIGVMEASVYAEYGDEAFKANHYEGNYDANINVTKRTTGIFNIVDELMRYEEGVCEKEVIQLTDQLLGNAFDPKYQFEYGKEYIVFVTIDSEIVGGYELPVLKNAVMADYKKSLLKAEFVESNWKGADFKFSFAGNTHYLVGWLPVAEVEQYIMGGLGASAEEIIPFFINAYGVYSSGAIIPVENLEIGETIALADLASRSFYEWAQDLMTDTEYYLYIYPFNAPGGESDFYSLSPTKDDVYIYGTFATGSVEVGDFDAAAQFEIVSWQDEYVEEWEGEYPVLTAKATFGADVTDIVYIELSEPIEDPEEGIFEVMNSVYRASAKAEGGVTIKIVYPSDPAYLGVVAINAEGQGVYVQHKFEKPLPPATDVTAVNVVAEQGHYSENGGCYHSGEMKVTFTLPNDENAVIYFKTGNNEAADVICDAYHKPAYDYLYVGDWFDWNKSTNGKWYLGATLNGDDAVIYGPIVVGYGAEGYTFSFQIDGYKVTYTGNVSGLTVPEGYEGGEPEQPAIEVIEMNPVSRATYDGYNLKLFSEDGRYRAEYYLNGIVDKNKGYIPAGEYTVGTDSPGLYGYGYSALYDYEAGTYTHTFDVGGVMSVSEVDGAYHIEFNGGLTAKSDSSAATMEFVFDGDIENLILPSEYVEPAVLDFTPVRADYDLKLVAGNDSEYAYWLYDANNNYIEVICHYNKTTGWNYVFEGKFVVNGETCEISKITTQMPSDYNCAAGEKYFAIGEVKFANGTVYSYTGQLPAVEVNYEGDGADYVPGAGNAAN